MQPATSAEQVLQVPVAVGGGRKNKKGKGKGKGMGMGKGKGNNNDRSGDGGDRKNGKGGDKNKRGAGKGGVCGFVNDSTYDSKEDTNADKLKLAVELKEWYDHFVKYFPCEEIDLLNKEATKRKVAWEVSSVVGDLSKICQLVETYAKQAAVEVTRLQATNPKKHLTTPDDERLALTDPRLETLFRSGQIRYAGKDLLKFVSGTVCKRLREKAQLFLRAEPGFATQNVTRAFVGLDYEPEPVDAFFAHFALEGDSQPVLSVRFQIRTGEMNDVDADKLGVYNYSDLYWPHKVTMGAGIATIVELVANPADLESLVAPRRGSRPSRSNLGRASTRNK